MSITVIKAGMQTSIQDGGRPGFMHWGVAKGGAMDPYSMALANQLLGNPKDHPVLEICVMGPVLRFSQTVSLAVCGAQFELWRHHKGDISLVMSHQCLTFEAGEELHFGKRLEGARAYLALAATIDCHYVMGSASTHFLGEWGGLNGRALQTGDRIELSQCEQRPQRGLPANALQRYSGNYLLRCTDSVESGCFTQAQQQHFYQQTYKLGKDANRMGLRLDGKALPDVAMQELVSSGLTPGSIQIPPSGLPIIASVDGQTIGGYPRIANVISADLFALGQLVPGDKIRFVYLPAEQARQILLNQYRSHNDSEES